MDISSIIKFVEEMVAKLPELEARLAAVEKALAPDSVQPEQPQQTAPKPEESSVPQA